MTPTEYKFFIAEQAHKYFQSKVRQPKTETPCGGTPLTYYTYKVEAALFGEDFHEAPTIHEVDVRLSDDDYLRLLQWQLQHPNWGFNHLDIDVQASIEIAYQVEQQLFPDDNVGTYAVYLTEIREDVEAILKTINDK